MVDFPAGKAAITPVSRICFTVDRFQKLLRKRQFINTIVWFYNIGMWHIAGWKILLTIRSINFLSDCHSRKDIFSSSFPFTFRSVSAYTYKTLLSERFTASICLKVFFPIFRKYLPLFHQSHGLHQFQQSDPGNFSPVLNIPYSNFAHKR